MLQSFESRYLFSNSAGFVNRSCSHFSHCKLFTRLQSGLMFSCYYIFSLLPPQHAIAIRSEQQGRRATRQQVSAPARTEWPGSPVTAAPRATSRAALPSPPASVRPTRTTSTYSDLIQRIVIRVHCTNNNFFQGIRHIVTSNSLHNCINVNKPVIYVLYRSVMISLP